MLAGHDLQAPQTPFRESSGRGEQTIAFFRFCFITRLLTSPEIVLSCDHVIMSYDVL